MAKKSDDGGFAEKNQTGHALQPALTQHMFKPYAAEDQMRNESRIVSLFRNGRNQSVRIPVEFELPGTKAIMRREGDRLVLEAVRKRGLAELLRSWDPLDEDFPEIKDAPVEPEDVF